MRNVRSTREISKCVQSSGLAGPSELPSSVGQPSFLGVREPFSYLLALSLRSLRDVRSGEFMGSGSEPSSMGGLAEDDDASDCCLLRSNSSSKARSPSNPSSSPLGAPSIPAVGSLEAFLRGSRGCLPFLGPPCRGRALAPIQHPVSLSCSAGFCFPAKHAGHVGIQGSLPG